MRLAWSPNAGGANAGDKEGSGTVTGVARSGWDAIVSLSSDFTGVDGLSLDVGLSQVSQDTTHGTTDGDKEETVVAATYAVGNWTVGYQWTEVELGTSSGAQKYTNDGWGITFNVNDDLSVGYNHYESEQDNDTDVTTEATSIQVAYTMGGASIRLADSEVDNPLYSTSAADLEATTLSVALAF